MLAIDIVEGCNFACYFCRAKTVKINQYIDLSLFKRIIDEAKVLDIDCIMLTPNRGEPFLHPDIYEIIDYSGKHMKKIFMFSNATAINVQKLSKVITKNFSLHVSKYGNNISEFKKLTLASDNLYRIFQKKLVELQSANIKFILDNRNVDYDFDYDNQSRKQYPMNISEKCKHHYHSKILVNGDVTFCIAAREEFPNSSKIRYANLNDMTLKEALEHPLRYKFMDSQSICKHSCTTYGKSCHYDASIVPIKLMASSKNNYKNNVEEVDLLYSELENEIIQPNL